MHRRSNLNETQGRFLEGFKFVQFFYEVSVIMMLSYVF